MVMLLAAPHLQQWKHTWVKTVLLESRISPYNLGTEGTKEYRQRNSTNKVYPQKTHLWNNWPIALYPIAEEWILSAQILGNKYNTNHIYFDKLKITGVKGAASEMCFCKAWYFLRFNQALTHNWSGSHEISGEWPTSWI